MSISVETLTAALKKSKALKNPERLDPARPLPAQGVDSLEMVSIYLAVEENFDIKIPDEDANALITLNDLVAYVEKKSG